MCGYHCKPKNSYNLTKMAKAIFMDLITLAFVLEYVQWQPRIIYIYIYIYIIPNENTVGNLGFKH